MRLALLQAQKVLGNTKTNPAVGCVLVKNQNVISAGSTGINGRPHAEVNTLNFSKVNDYKSHLYSKMYVIRPQFFIPIITNKGCKMVIENEAFHMPANGSAYLTDNRQ